MLLDTCALLWLAHDQTRMSEETLKKIDKAPVVFIVFKSFDSGVLE